jgi:hypothetical protein
MARVKQSTIFLTRYPTHVKEMAIFLTCLLFIQHHTKFFWPTADKN